MYRYLLPAYAARVAAAARVFFSVRYSEDRARHSDKISVMNRCSFVPFSFLLSSLSPSSLYVRAFVRLSMHTDRRTDGQTDTNTQLPRSPPGVDLALG